MGKNKKNAKRKRANRRANEAARKRFTSSLRSKDWGMESAAELLIFFATVVDEIVEMWGRRLDATQHRRIVLVYRAGTTASDSMLPESSIERDGMVVKIVRMSEFARHAAASHTTIVEQHIAGLADDEMVVVTFRGDLCIPIPQDTIRELLTEEPEN